MLPHVLSVALYVSPRILLADALHLAWTLQKKECNLMAVQMTDGTTVPTPADEIIQLYTNIGWYMYNMLHHMG